MAVRTLVEVVVAVVMLVASACVAAPAPGPEKDGVAAYRWCVPDELRANCSRLVEGAGVPIACVGGLDRVDCLRKVRGRQADYLMADPEDAYVAAHLDNQDFLVFGEQRSLEEPTAPFRYEGIMLVRVADGFRSLADLRGKKSCHTGFGRNVGYKIPVARLQRAGVLKLQPAGDGALSPIERELAALSELFSASCLPGSYSPHAEIDQLLKQRYANLCERCAAPAQCSRQDRYGGYDGAIRCLVENGGDVAFTKTIFVRKYFGLPVTPGGVAKPALNPDANAADYAYLCEDGTTRPIADGTPACSWAQRPWPVLLANGDVSGAGRTSELQQFTQQLQRFAGEAPEADRPAALALRLNPATPLADRQQLVTPRDYLQSAHYVEVIEREGAYGGAIRLCVTSEAERQKCDLLRRAAYSRDIRPTLACVLKTEEACVAAVRAGQEADVVVLKQHPAQLQQLVTEVYGDAGAGAGKDGKANAAAVYVRPDVDEAVRDSIVHAFTAISEAFGRGKPNAQVFRLFGPFRLQDGVGQEVGHDLLFHDDASGLLATSGASS